MIELKAKFRPRDLRRARKTFRHSQEAAARFMGVAWQTVSRWERGVAAPQGLYRDKVEDYIREAANVKSGA